MSWLMWWFMWWPCGGSVVARLMVAAPAPMIFVGPARLSPGSDSSGGPGDVLSRRPAGDRGRGRAERYASTFAMTSSETSKLA